MSTQIKTKKNLKFTFLHSLTFRENPGCYRPDPHFAGYERPSPVAGRAMGRFLGPQSAGGLVRWPVKPVKLLF
jgi:hypothetical protein